MLQFGADFSVTSKVPFQEIEWHFLNSDSFIIVVLPKGWLIAEIFSMEFAMYKKPSSKPEKVKMALMEGIPRVASN